MELVLIQIVLLGFAIRFVWQAHAAWQSGVVTFRSWLHPVRHFPRATRPVVFWMSIIVYLLFAAAVLASFTIELTML